MGLGSIRTGVVVTCALCLVGLTVLAGLATADPPCNGEEPFLDNCGQEDTCEDRSDEQTCVGTYGKYYEDFAGVDCLPGDFDDHCEPVSGPMMKCTCEFSCTWDEMGAMCEKGAAHMFGTEHVCSKQTRYDSQPCEIPGS